MRGGRAANAPLANLPIHQNPGKFYIRAGELVDNRIPSHPVNEMQMRGDPQIGHGGVASLSNSDLIKPGGPKGNDPIAGYRDWGPNDRIDYPGSRIYIAGGHHRTEEIRNRVMSGEMDPNTIIEVVIRE